MSDSVGTYLLADFFLRSLGMILLSVTLYRTGIIHGSKPQEFYRRMALTNYLAQSLVGILLLRVVLDRGDLSRSAIAGFVLTVWTLQLTWSQWWLERFRFGPAEWACDQPPIAGSIRSGVSVELDQGRTGDTRLAHS